MYWVAARGVVMSLHLSSWVAEHVASCLQLALLLEVSAYPKPGNIHRTADFQETRYEHFLASIVGVTPHFRHAAERGFLVRIGKIRPHEVGIGKVIKGAARSMNEWQHGGNTLLGSIILLSPIAVAAGITLAGDEGFSPSGLRDNVKMVVKSSTPMDAVAVYDAIEMVTPGGLGKAPKLDVTDPSSKRRILEDGVTLFDVFRISSEYDSVSSEWVNGYPITFEMGYPYLIQQLRKTRDLNTAIVHTFLKVLSEVPDTLIARKAGWAKAREVSVEARQVLSMGGLTTEAGRRAIWRFDEKLRDPAHKLNPGTTADIVSAILAVCILNGYRP
ncbi:MAG: triphosphoribosyl-dephospho-CoA synthase [Candidatus Freyarchaeota archaeon]